MSELTDLIADLVAVDSVNPDLVPGGAGEEEIARVVAEWLERRGLEVRVEVTKAGRPNVVARMRGARSGRTLLLLAHTDTVGAAGMEAPFESRVEDGRLHGRGAYDMKSGLAAAMCAVADLTDLDGEVMIAAVCDEEAGGTGTKALLASGDLPDAAIVTEPTDLKVVTAHKGFAGFEIETAGKAAHGSRPDLGVDAILGIGPVLAELSELNRKLQQAPPHPLLGTASLHASLIEGGHEASSYPEHCVLTGEWRTLPGDDPGAALREAVRRSGVEAELRLTYEGDPFETSAEAEIVEIVRRHAGTEIAGLGFWADSAQLAAKGVPTVLFGPEGAGAHASDEWVDLDSARRVQDVLVATALDFCDPRFTLHSTDGREIYLGSKEEFAVGAEDIGRFFSGVMGGSSGRGRWSFLVGIDAWPDQERTLPSKLLALISDEAADLQSEVGSELNQEANDLLNRLASGPSPRSSDACSKKQ